MSLNLAPGVTVQVDRPEIPEIRTQAPSSMTAVVPIGGPAGPPGPQGLSGPPGPAGGIGYHHVQLIAAETWTVTHGLGYQPGGILVKDSSGEIVEFADVIYVGDSTLQIMFPGLPISGTAEVS